MKPCSAWCRSDEGIHVVLGWASEGDPLDSFVGRVVTLNDRPGICIPARTKVRILSEEFAREAPPPSDDVRRRCPGTPVAILTTMQVVDHRDHVHVSLT